MKVLIEKTASSLDDTALKMLFVSVQQNNIELCIRYAIDEYDMFLYCLQDFILTFFRLTPKVGYYNIVCPHHQNANGCVRLNFTQDDFTYYTMSWFGHSFVSEWQIN